MATGDGIPKDISFRDGVSYWDQQEEIHENSHFSGEYPSGARFRGKRTFNGLLPAAARSVAGGFRESRFDPIVQLPGSTCRLRACGYVE